MSWEMHIQDATAAVRRSDCAAAESALKNALQFAKQNYSRDDGRLAIALSFLGHVYFCMSDFLRAERLLEQSLRMHFEVRKVNEPCAIMDLFALAEVKKSLGKAAEACKLYDDTRELFLISEGSQPSVVELAIERFKSLADQTRASLTERQREWLRNPHQSMATPTDGIKIPDLGTAGGADDAPALPLPQMTRTQSETGSLDDVWQRQFQTGLSSMTAEDAECDELVTAYLNLESAYRLATSMFVRSDMRLIATTKALADACTKLKMFEEAQVLYEQAISQVRGSQDNAAAGKPLKLALALSHVESGKFKQAMEIFDEENFEDLPTQAEPLRKRVEEAHRLIKVYNQTCNLIEQARQAEDIGDLDRAARLTNNALSQLKQGFPPGHIENAQILRYRSELLSKLEQHEQAVEMVQRAERVERAHEAQLAQWARLVEELPKIETSVAAV